MNRALRILLISFFILSGLIVSGYAAPYDNCLSHPDGPLSCILDGTGSVILTEEGGKTDIRPAIGSLLLVILFSSIFVLGTRRFFAHNNRMAVGAAIILGILSTLGFSVMLENQNIESSPALFIGSAFFLVLVFGAAIALIYYGSKWVTGQKEDGADFTNIFKLFLLVIIAFVALTGMAYAIDATIENFLTEENKPKCSPSAGGGEAEPCDAEDIQEAKKSGSKFGWFVGILATLGVILGTLALISFLVMVVITIIFFFLLILGLIGLTGGAIYAGSKWFKVRSQRNNPAGEIRKDLKEIDDKISRVEKRFEKMNDFLKRGEN